ncbi:MAG: CBS domain-containing protein [Planctomycetes bacterium]|nr:CBS domain-containing protein [Planctomycetota bacterium]
MTLDEILRSKGTQVFTISPDATLDDVVQALVARNCGSLVVCRDDGSMTMVGIITERDILRACAANQGALHTVRVVEVMSEQLVTGSVGDEVETVMGVMTRERIRHLPVVEEGRLIGLVSIGDIVKAQHDRLTMENHFLKEYIQI